MSDLLDGATGERMKLDAYRADFQKNFWSIKDPGFWKLERQQVFKDTGSASWEAFARGDWNESMRLLEASRADVEQDQRKIAEHGFVTARARIVEEPISAYLQWELNALCIRDEAGGPTHVVRPEHVARFETNGPLPEINLLGSNVMYEAVYDDEGVIEHAVRYLDRDLILRCQRFIADLFEAGEPLKQYFARKVALLPPPGPQYQI